ncbi:MAG TPA: aldo/keto reductase [Candidatus Dormibacteraeota bacterium]|jgi:aryl-alcohol dehydrogenase-like predicted oxidoreductase|nr:aldo/keto reductase [Candidatus Dormibacteraeota bacterium]
MTRYRRLGGTGVKVSPLCLGTMMFGAWGNKDHDGSIAIINRALDAGINFVDTADVYSSGESEEIVGKALKGRRDTVVVASKVHGRMGDDINQRGNSRRWIMQEVDNSLRRLDTDWIDLYQIHRPDPKTDIEETLGALTDLAHAGKIRYFGSSTYPAESIAEAQWAATRSHLGSFVTEQPPYSIFARGIETAVLPTAQRYNMGVLAWSPLNGGWLTGKYRKDHDTPEGSRMTIRRIPERFDLSLPGNARKLDLVEDLDQLAQDVGITMTQLALAWVLEHPAVTSAIIGPRTMEQLEGNLGADDTRLDKAVLDRIDELVPPGTNLNPSDAGYYNPWLEPTARRRSGAAG